MIWGRILKMDANMKEKLVPAALGFLVGVVFVGALAHLGVCPFQKGADDKKPDEPAKEGKAA